MLVRRNIGGVPTIVHEVLQDPWESENFMFSSSNYNNVKPYTSVDVIPGSCVYLDCAIKATGSGTSWAVGSNILAESDVSVIADGKYIGEVSIAPDATGTFTLTRAATEVWVGYIYKGRLKTNPIEQGGQFGQPVGKVKRIDEIVVALFRTGSGRVGASEESMEELEVRKSSQPGNEATDYFTGDKHVLLPMGYGTKAQIIIEQHQPTPMFIIGVTAHGQSND
jgi:hypothetical protein